MVAGPVLADSHIHLFADGFIGPDGRSPAGGDEVSEYEKLRQRLDIDTALVVGYEGEAAYGGNNDYLAAIARDHSWIKPLAYLDHSATHAEAQKRLDNGCYGLSIYAVEENDAESLSGLLARIGPVIAERRALISFNVAPAVYPALRTALDSLRGVPILISHFGLPTKGAGTGAEALQALSSLGAMQDNPDILVKASGFYAFGGLLDPQEALSMVIEQFGAWRVLWGSDYPVVLSSEPFDQTIDYLSALREEERRALLGDNLRAILAEAELP